MYLNNLMNDHHMSRANLVRKSGVPDSTLRDILNGTAQIDHCEAGTLYFIARALHTSVEEILAHYYQEKAVPEKLHLTALHDSHSTLDFHTYASFLGHLLRDIGEKRFVESVINGDMVKNLLDKECYRNALLVIGLVDYICTKNGQQLPRKFNNVRRMTLDYPVYSLNTMEKCLDCQTTEKATAYSQQHAIPELARFRIFMTEDEIFPSGVN